MIYFIYVEIKSRSPLWYELPLIFFIVGGIIAFVKIKKDDPVKARRCIFIGIITTIPIIIVLVFIVMLGSGTTFFIASGSMIPVLEVNDAVRINKNIIFDDITIGDIIVFNRPSDHDRTIVHRVVSILDDDPKTIKTKGDANRASISGTDFPITEKEYIGKVDYVIPQIGYVTRILTPPINYIIIGIIIAVMVIKQISKGRKEKETDSTIDFESFDQNNPNESTGTFDDLNNIPKDKEYSEISDEVRNAALREEGINPDSEKKNPQETNSDSNKKKPDE